MTLGHVGADQGAPGYYPPLEGVDHTLVEVLPLPDGGACNQPDGVAGVEWLRDFNNLHLEKTFLPPFSSLELFLL